MHRAVTVRSNPTSQAENAQRLKRLAEAIDHAAHLLPAQGPITVFVHHNTLHAFEDERFDAAILHGQSVFGCEPYLSEERYRDLLASGRILREDLEAVLLDDLGGDGDELIGFMGTRYQLRLGMLAHSWRYGLGVEVRWLIAETNALFRFRRETPGPLRRRAIEETRRWVQRDLRGESIRSQRQLRPAIEDLLRQSGKRTFETWNDAHWESLTLHLLWRICRHGVHRLPPSADVRRHRTPALHGNDGDLNDLVNEPLIRFCGAFLDQGFAHWQLPDRDQGFFQSFLKLYRNGRPPERWLQQLPAELQRIVKEGLTPLESIDESLHRLGIDERNRELFVERELLALRGWAGMLWQMETNAEWAARPAPRGSLMEYLAVRLLIKRMAAMAMASRIATGRNVAAPRSDVDQRAFLVFQLAQIRGWTPLDLHRQSPDEWRRLMHEIEGFSNVQRRRIFHLAYERRYRIQLLDAVLAHGRRQRATMLEPAEPAPPSFQIVCCIDEREESFRRHLEEIDGSCETFGVAGFFGIAMYYRGASEAHYRPLCPVNIKPRHYVSEAPDYSIEESSRRQAEARRALGRAAHYLHIGTRTFAGGLATGLLGSLATFPLLLRVLFPRAAAQLRRIFDRIVTPPHTHLHLERADVEPGPRGDGIGFTVDEMVHIVAGVLRTIGLTHSFSRLIIMLGHGSVSLNNPHEAAHDCGACGGGRGGPNARAFAQMANDPRVRKLLVARGIRLPDATRFVGGYHNTCDDSLTYYDLDQLPRSHHAAFERAKNQLEDACRRNAHERCRRFESADLRSSEEATLRHVEARAEDLSQVRPEYGHATNAICLVGRRAWSRGLFLDRRAFLASYDPSQDDESCAILAGLLQAVIPVCAGISLEYYFSHVDPTGYGCGTKLPHNITSLLGVMDGAASDLRPGLPWQMVEIHEPVRILFVIETTPESMLRLIDGNPAFTRLVRNEWVQLATLTPDSSTIHVFRNGAFELYEPESAELPAATSSLNWYRGQRDHLGFAAIANPAERLEPVTEEAT